MKQLGSSVAGGVGGEAPDVEGECVIQGGFEVFVGCRFIATVVTDPF